MNPEEFEKLPIIGLPGTESSPPTGYTEIQKLLLPYVDLYHFLLWIGFFGVLGYLIFKFLLIPTLQDVKNKKGSKK